MGYFIRELTEQSGILPYLLLNVTYKTNNRAAEMLLCFWIYATVHDLLRRIVGSERFLVPAGIESVLQRLDL